MEAVGVHLNVVDAVGDVEELEGAVEAGEGGAAAAVGAAEGDNRVCGDLEAICGG